MKKFTLSIGLLLLCTMVPLFAEDEITDVPSMETSFGFAVGTVTLDGITYNSVRLQPELVAGNLGIGLDIDFRFTMAPDENGDSEFKVYEKDWYLADGATFQEYMNLYLSKFHYIRWGKPQDSLYLRFGALTGSNLGTGFVMGGYTNTLFEPSRKIFGGEFNLDGELFNFPYLGFQGVVGNISEWDLYGGRLYIRPAAFTDISIVKNIQIGSSFYSDWNAYVYSEDLDNNGLYDFDDFTSVNEKAEAVYVSGFDAIIPIVANDILSLNLMGDFVLQGLENSKKGGMVGLAGNVTFLTYNTQVRFMGDDFQPVIFDRTYDLLRPMKQFILSNEGPAIIEAHNAYLASLGTSFMNNSLVFNISVEGPFDGPTQSADFAPWEYPRVKGILVLKEGVVDFADFQFWYDKQAVDTWGSLVSPEDAIIGGLINFHMAPAVITMQVDVQFDPDNTDQWTVTSQVSAGVKF